MRRPNFFLLGVALACLAFIVGQYAALTWLVPRHVVRAVERAAGGRLSVGSARLTFPLTTTLTRLHLIGNTSAFAVSIPKVVIKPRWVSFPSRTLWVDTLEIERPLVRLSRTKAGALVWPAAPWSMTPQASAASSSWSISIDSIHVTDGIVEFIDEVPAAPFHGALDHLSLVMGPIAIPLGSTPLAFVPVEAGPRTGRAAGAGFTFAVRGLLLGANGEGAQAYASGWLDPSSKDLHASCRLEPIKLAAFEPYYHGPLELRVYDTTLKSTSQWMAKSNQFNAHLQLELGNLREGDLSIHGRTIVNVKKMTSAEPELRLSGEISLAGLLDRPQEWRAEFLPGDERVQGLLERLRERGVAVVRVPVGPHRVHVSLTPSTKQTMTEIEAASREVAEALDILAAPEPAAAPPASHAPAPTTTPESPSVPTTPPAAQPGP